MSRDQIANRLLGYFRSRAPDPAIALTASTRLIDDWLLDSLGILDALLYLEDEFGVAMQRADITAETFGSVSSLTDFIAAHIGS